MAQNIPENRRIEIFEVGFRARPKTPNRPDRPRMGTTDTKLKTYCIYDFCANGSR